MGAGWEIQEVSRVGAQGVTSKSKLLAREMPRGVQQTDACATERENCRSIEGYSPLRTCLNTALAVFVSVWAVPSGAACVGYRYQEATIAYERLAPLLAADGTTAVVLAKSSSVCA